MGTDQNRSPCQPRIVEIMTVSLQLRSFAREYSIGYGMMLIMFTVPEFVPTPIWMNMIITATTIVWLGAYKQAAHSHSPSEERSFINEKEAYRFPFMASFALFGLFVVLKFLPKEYILMFVSLYAVFAGVVAFSGILTFFLQPVVHPSLSSNPRTWNLAPSFLRSWISLEIQWTWLDVLCLIPSLSVGVVYWYSRHYVTNNIIAAALCLTAIQMISIGSYKVGCILLCGLFVYDIFWVFGTTVMVTVAKGLDAPIKMLFPKDIFADPRQFSMLGLGDIVVPGLFVALMLKYDIHRATRQNPAGASTHFPHTYFHSVMVGYFGGLALTYLAMAVTGAAQPALLYLVPTCLGSTLATALYRGEFKDLISFEDPHAVADAAAAATAEKKSADTTAASKAD
eukprot:TRINITY_DN12805_c0_g1::TRINITY_DN12805_c0_g1_i1::g.28666::m.28666 TRINITY_DN12805_c0_g1::TRINITY_DN12805_c0_g1_i1::g.28666  ORF type:complete len:397 (-),score=75.15,sp/Q8TCT9/HM13_HUMAN/35.44/6e-65,Peptidase_A22B/PF04258.8/1.7e-73,DUF423/PF04241.10/0.0055,DUF423/PF04241.10/3.3e+03,DUF1119/PF06550.6/8.9e+02,DUF1119/PF06550.6/0.017 TRINITY_DN12805_c0_g1_i1:235-1425(-)